MDFLTKTSKAILSGTGYLKDFASGLLTKKITYAEGTPEPVRQAPALRETPMYSGTPVPDEFKPALEKAYGSYAKDLPPGILEATMMMESSMGTNRANEKYDLGKYGWLTGLTKTGHAADIIKNKDSIPYEVFKKDAKGNPYFKGAEDASTPEGALGLTASTWAVLKRNNPDLSSEEIYFQLYNANPEVDKPERRRAFKEYLDFYSKPQGKSDEVSFGKLLDQAKGVFGRELTSDEVVKLKDEFDKA